uniref:Uncharacterized protein n=1 Tax=Anguilla anguilla TaxID=7936 RepID=A0A0E9WQI8_ANGAN
MIHMNCGHMSKRRTGLAYQCENKYHRLNMILAHDLSEENGRNNFFSPCLHQSGLA